MHEIFFLAACLGFRKGKRKALGRDGDDRFWSSTITPEEYASFYAMVIESNSMGYACIADDRAVIAAMEEYANAGMDILINDVLSECTVARGDDLRLDPSCSQELPKLVLAYVYEKTAE